MMILLAARWTSIGILRWDQQYMCQNDNLQEETEQNTYLDQKIGCCITHSFHMVTAEAKSR